MGEIGNNINFTVNEIRPVIDNLNDSNNENLNGSAENKLSTVESGTYFQSSTVTEEQVLTTVSKYCQNVKPNDSFTITDNFTCVLSNNSQEAGTKNDSINSLNQVCETAPNSEIKCNVPVNISVGEISGGSVDILPDALSGETCNFNLMNIRNSVIQCNESSISKVENPNFDFTDAKGLKDGENNSSLFVQDLVDFSFKEQENISVDLNENFTIDGSVPKHPETSITTPGETCLIDTVANKQENVPVGTTEELPQPDSVKVPYELSTNEQLFSVIKDSSMNCDIVFRDSIHNDSSHALDESKRKSDVKVPGFESFSLDLSAGCKTEVMNSKGTAIQSSEIPSGVETHKFSPLKEGKISFDKPREQFFDSDNAISLPVSSRKKLDVSLEEESILYEVSDKPLEKFSVEAHENPFNEEQISPLKVGNVSFGISNKPLENLSDSESNCKVPKILSSVELDQVSPLKVENVSFGMADKPLEQFSDSKVDSKPFNEEQVSPLEVGNVSFGMSDKPLQQFSDSEIVCKVPKVLSSVEQDQVSPLKVGNVSFGMTDKPLEQFSDSKIDSKVPEDPLSIEDDQASPLKLESVSFDMRDKTFVQLSDPKIAFKMSENILSNEVFLLKGENLSFNMSAKLVEQFSDVDGAGKLSENSIDRSVSSVNENVSLNLSDKPIQQCSDHDFTFKVPEVPLNNPLGQLRNPAFAFKVPEKSLTNEEDEQFVDAAQFFRDPNSFQFLENIRTSTIQPGPAAPRSSLYVNFDPLHSKLQTNIPRLDNCELISAAVQDQRIPPDIIGNHSSEVKNKHLVDVATRESMGNILISFDSPKSSTSMDNKMPVELQSSKMFTEEELQRKLKIHYLETQEAYLKKQREKETEIATRDELLGMQQLVLEEFCGISFKLSEEIKSCKEEVKSLKEENEKLKEDLKTSTEDVQNVENTFTDFYKRYDQCKGMLKTYKDNEEQLKKTILDLQDKAKEQEEMYHALQKRTEEMLEKANVEVDIAKRSGEAQVTVLKAQLKKAEMKISSLESDNKQIKMENSQLGGICDDLMAKVSQS